MRVFALALVFAFAGPPSYDEAAAAYEAGDFERAADLFDELVRDEPKPEYLYSLAQSLRRSNQCERAEHEFRRYLATGVTDSQLEAVETLIAECDEGEKAEAEATGETGGVATPEAGGEPEGPTEPRPAPPLPSEGGDPAALIRGGAVGVALGGAVAIGGAVLLGVFVARQDRENQGYRDKGCDDGVDDSELFLTCQAHQDNATTAASLAFGAGVPALVLGVAGVTFGAIAIGVGRKRKSELDMRVGFDLSNPGLVLSGRF